MAQPVYATDEEYGESPYGQATAPADIAARLAIASRHIDRLVMCAYYDTDENQAPTEEDVIEALRDATIAQASYTIDSSAGLGEGQLPAGVSSASIGSASLTRSKAAPEIRLGGILYSPEVFLILGNLANGEPYPR